MVGTLWSAVAIVCFGGQQGYLYFLNHRTPAGSDFVDEMTVNINGILPTFDCFDNVSIPDFVSNNVFPIESLEF
ncbi:MAG: hypothetical protein R2788_26220 [Saprospiraceae bacterium]